jgi:hypothetical protein
LAPLEGDPPHCSDWLCSALVALLVTMTTVSATLAAPASSGPQQRSRPARFSDLAELTPANVHGLLPLVAREFARQVPQQGSQPRQLSSAHRLQVDSLAGTDLSLQRFLDERVRLHLEIDGPARLPSSPGARGYEVSYATGPAATAATPAAGAPIERELRAWDPIERRVVWSVTEALPISARTLITAGGLVFYGTSDGWLKALDARTGTTLWTYRAEDRELDEPYSYRGTDGHQYIAVHSQPHAGAPGRETLLSFALAH